MVSTHQRGVVASPPTMRFFLCLHVVCAAGFLRSGSRIKARDSDVYLVAKLLDRLKVATLKRHAFSEQRYDNERARLKAAANSAKDADDRALLWEALSKSEDERTEEEAATTEMFQYYYTVKGMMGSASEAPSCKFLLCGLDAECEMAHGTAMCKCKRCFKGDGFICNPVACKPDTVFSAQPLTGAEKPASFSIMGLGGTPTSPQNVKEIRIASYARGRVAVVVRDAGQKNRGFLLLGKLGEKDELEWGDWKGFSGEKPAYGPRVVGFANGRFVIAYRDAEKEGTGYLLAGYGNDTNILDPILGSPDGFVRKQEQPMALVTVSGSRVVCLYAEHWPDGSSQSGGAALAQVGKEGDVSLLGRYRFAQGQVVSQLTVVSLTPTSLVAAYRGLPASSEPTGMPEPSKELSAVWMGLTDDGELVVNGRAVSLEPQRAGFLERSLALVSQSQVAYSYYSEVDKALMMTILQIDPVSHAISVTSAARPITKGKTAYVGAIALPSDSYGAQSFTYYQMPKANGEAKLCRISPEGRISNDCRKLPWADSQLGSVNGARLPNGRLVFVFSDDAGAPSFQYVGASELEPQIFAS